MKRILRLLAIAAIAVTTSCGPAKDIIYIQDLPPNAQLTLQADGELVAEAGDKLSVTVHSRDQELARMFNLSADPQATATPGRASHSLYTVDKAGNIDMPVLGNMHVAGKTRLEIADMVKYKLLAGSLLRDPVVTVEFPRMAYYVIGESGTVGRHEFPDDKLNLLEALSISGDLNINGRRTNVRVLRTEGGKQTAYHVDLTKTDQLYASPAYYIHQNDMIYVEPNQVRQNQSTANGSSYMTPTFWISMLSFAATVAVLIAK